MNKRKILAMLLAVVMICSLFVSPALAADDEGIVAISANTEAPKFTDLEEGHWAESAIIRWAEEGIIEGDGDGTINPARSLKRAELATVLTRLLGLKDKASADTFSDVAANAWYADAVLKCAKAGIMLGDGTGKANPEAPIDRQQTIVMVGRALGVKPATGHSLDRFDDGDTVADWAAPYMIALTDMNILNGLPTGEGDGAIVAPTVNIDRASTFTLLDKAIAQYITAPCTVTVNDPNKFVVVNSAAEEKGVVTVTGETAGVVVATGTTDDVVLDKATVGTLKVDAPVDVTVNRGSSVTDLDANAPADVTNNGTVTNLNTNADDVTFDGNKPSKVNTAEDVKPATDSKGNEVTEAPTTSGGGSSSGNRPSARKADVVGAPSVDQKAGGFGENVTDSETKAEGTVKTAATEETAGEYDVKITATGVKNHTNANNADAHWVGFGIPAVEGNTYWDGDQEIISAKSRTIEVNGKTYNTIYFDDNDQKTTKVITVKNGDKVTATYNVTFDVTFYKATDVTVKAELVTAEGDAHPFNELYSMAAIGATVKQTGYDLTLDGEIDTTKLNKNSGENDPKEYTYFYLTVRDANINTIVGVATANGNEGAANDDYLQAVRIWDSANKQLLKVSHEYTLKDAVGRVQDTFTVSVDATACSVKGMNKVTFVDADGKVIGNKLTDEENNTVVLPATPAHSDKWYYTGKWFAGETEFTAATEVTADVTVKAEAKPVGAQALKDRPVGPAGAIPSFDYASAYAKAGVKLTGSNGEYTYTVDGKTFLEYAETENNDLDKLAHTMEDGTTYYFYGVGIQAPAKAVELVVAKTMAALDDEENSTTYTQGESEHFFDGEVLNYFGAVAEKKNEVYGFQKDGSFTRYTKWLDAAGNVLEVNKFVLKRVTTPAQFNVTFKDDGKTVETKTVDYNTAIGKLPEVPAAKPGYTGGKWALEDGTEITATSKFTTDTTVEATYTAIEYTIHYDGVAESATMTVESTEDHTLKAAPTADTAHEGYHFTGWQILTACGESDEGAVEDQNEAGKYYKWVDFSGKVAPADLPVKAVGKDANCIHFQSVWAPNYEVSFEAMSAEVYDLYKGDREFGVNIPALDQFQTAMTFETGAKAGAIVVKGELLPITNPAYDGFNGSNPKEQTGYYLLFQFEAPKGTKDGNVSGDIVTTDKKRFTTAALDKVGEKEIFSFIWWLAEPTTEANATLEGKTIELTIDWDGDKADGLTGTKYTLDLSGVTLKAAEASIPDQGGEETASLSAVESENVTAPVDAIVPADEEIAEVPVLD